MAREIFISYSRRDLEKVKAIKSEIEQATSMECWMDINDIQADEEDYLNRIAEGIEKCRVFLYMLSKSSQESEHAIGELVAAKDQKKKRGIHVVIINIDGCEMNTSFTIRFATQNAILWSDAPQKDNLIRNLRDWLGVDEAKRKAEEEAKRKAEEEHQKKLKELENIELRPIEENGKWGFADESGKVMIPYKWGYADDFSEGLALVEDDNGKRGYIDKTGKVEIPCKWKRAWDFFHGLARVMDDNGKWWKIDKTGKVVGEGRW